MNNSYQPGKKTISMYQYNYSWMSRAARDTYYQPEDVSEQWANERVEQLARSLIEWGEDHDVS